MVLKWDYEIFYEILLVFLDKNMLKFEFSNLKTSHTPFSIIEDD